MTSTKPKKSLIYFGIAAIVVILGLAYGVFALNKEQMFRAVETRILTQTNNDWQVTDATTTGSLYVTGEARFNSASSTSLNVNGLFKVDSSGNATTSDLVILDGDLNKDMSALTIWGSLTTGGTFTVGSIASATDYLIIGNNVANDDDNLYFDIGLNEYLGWDDDPGEFDLTDDLNITGNATTSLDIIAGGAMGTGTSTLQIKADTTGGNGSSCLEMVNVEGATYAIYINGAGTLTAQVGTCK
ncbi:MAG: hypothetical protein ACOZAL_01100 [Patescibacteria group bacterium]